MGNNGDWGHIEPAEEGKWSYIEPMDKETGDRLLENLAKIDSEILEINNELKSKDVSEELVQHVNSAMESLEDINTLLAEQKESNE